MNWRVHIQNFGPASRIASFGAPVWVIWTSLIVALLVVVIPLAVLFILAALVGVILFFALLLVVTIQRFVQDSVHWFRRVITRSDDHGRRNVTVLPRDPSDSQ
ncbi:MAG: hypothetical protein JKX85_12410 [Phycisphaeraceae bacterium]|nr:hypothetical protein [Phycisphaeraceae bacterium]